VLPDESIGLLAVCAPTSGQSVRRASPKSIACDVFYLELKVGRSARGGAAGGEERRERERRQNTTATESE
jgi:hypothetical protein